MCEFKFMAFILLTILFFMCLHNYITNKEDNKEDKKEDKKIEEGKKCKEK